MHKVSQIYAPSSIVKMTNAVSGRRPGSGPVSPSKARGARIDEFNSPMKAGYELVAALVELII